MEENLKFFMLIGHVLFWEGGRKHTVNGLGGLSHLDLCTCSGEPPSVHAGGGRMGPL